MQSRYGAQIVQAYHIRGSTSSLTEATQDKEENGQFPPTLVLQHKCNWEIERFGNLQRSACVSALRIINSNSKLEKIDFPDIMGAPKGSTAHQTGNGWIILENNGILHS